MSNNQAFYIGGNGGGKTPGNVFSGKTVNFYTGNGNALVGIEIVGGQSFGTCSGPLQLAFPAFPGAFELYAAYVQPYEGIEVLVGLSFSINDVTYTVGNPSGAALDFLPSATVSLAGISSGTCIDGLFFALQGGA